MVIIERPVSSTKQLGLKPMSYDAKSNLCRKRYSNSMVTLLEHTISLTATLFFIVS